MKFWSLAERNLKEIYRDPISVLLGLFLPIGLLMLFSSISERSQLELFTPAVLTPGIMIFSYSFLLMFAAMLLARDRKSAFLIRLFTTPLKASDFILAYSLPFVLLAVLQTILCFVAGVLMGGTFNHLLSALLVLILVAITCIGLGITLGALFSENQVSGIGSLLITLIGLFSGVWMDLRMVGGLFSTVGYALPFAHAVDAAVVLLSGASLAEVTDHILWVLVYAVLCFAFSVAAFSRAMKTNS